MTRTAQRRVSTSPAVLVEGNGYDPACYMVSAVVSTGGVVNFTVKTWWLYYA
jgi:hypothetical protein